MKKLLLLMLALQALACIYGQSRMDSMYDQLTARLDKVKQADAGTQLFLHVDKSVYMPTENIWFAGYVLRAPTLFSNHHTLYACLADPASKTVLASGKFVMEAGHAKGYIFLPDSIAAGNYQLIAFTNTFLQEPSAIPFVQSVKVHVPDKAGPTRGVLVNDAKAPQPEKSLHVNWYPESGSLVARVRTTVAFDVRYPSGKPYAFTGGSLLENGAPIATLSTNESGAGTFEFTPQEGKEYSIVPRAPGIELVHQTTPAIRKAGYNITVPQGAVGDTLRFTVQGRPRINTVYVLVHNFRQPLYFEEVSANVPRFTVEVPADKLPAGLCTITVFDSTATPVAERTVFAGWRQMSNVAVTMDAAEYHKRSRVRLSIRTTDAQGKGVPALLSLATVLRKRIDTAVYQDITSFYYFNPYVKNDVPYSMTPAQKRDIELFLLTKCQTGYRWADAVQSSPATTPAQEKLGIYGKLLYKGRKIPKPTEVIVINKNAVHTLMTDEQGYFELPPEFTATIPDWKLALTVNAKSKEDYSFETWSAEDSVFRALAGSRPSFRRVTGVEILQEELPEFIKAKKLDTVFVKATRKNQFESMYESGQKVYRSQTCNDYVCSYNILNCPRHRTGGQPPQDGNTYYVVDELTRQQTPIVYRACKQDAALPKLLLHKLNGRNYSKEFSINDFLADPSPELGATLLWSAGLVTDANGHAEVSFYTNDLAGSFVCIVQGVWEKGVVSGRGGFRVKQ